MAALSEPASVTDLLLLRLRSNYLSTLNANSNRINGFLSKITYGPVLTWLAILRHINKINLIELWTAGSDMIIWLSWLKYCKMAQ